MCHLFSVSKKTSESETRTILPDNVRLLFRKMTRSACQSSSMPGVLAFIFYRYEYCDHIVRINK